MDCDIPNRIAKIPPYLFSELSRIKKKQVAEGVDIIDMGLGCSDLPTPPSILLEMQRAVTLPESRFYPSSRGLKAFREQIAKWFAKRFDVILDPESEILPVVGSKDAIAHLPFAVLDPGDYVLCPNPAYPVYSAVTLLAGGIPYYVPLSRSNSYLPVLSELPQDAISKAKLLYLNYPHNPTGATCDINTLKTIVRFAHANSLCVCYDAAYSETAEPADAPSLMQIEGGRDVCLEVYSFSKTFGMAGWRLGFAVGGKHLIDALLRVKSYFDAGVFDAVQLAGIAALKLDDSHYKEVRNLYKRRRRLLTDGLSRIGLDIYSTNATLFVWVSVPGNLSSVQFAALLLEKASILCTPGSGFGECGEGHVRMSLAVSSERIEEALHRIESCIGAFANGK